MKVNNLFVMFSSLISLSVFPCALSAGQDPETEIFSLESGDYRIDISSKYNYTIRRICFKGYDLGTNTGFYGTVIAPESGKYIGSGHTEGGVEQVIDLSITVDNTKIEKIKNGVTLKGELLRFNKVSKLDNLLFTTSIELTSEGLTESKSFEAVEDQKIHMLCAFAYCLNVKTTDWIAELKNGSIESGIFKNDKGWHLQKDIKWAAQFDKAASTGVLLYHPSVLEGQGRKSTFWDVPKAYHKYYFMRAAPPVIKKGFKSEKMILKVSGFSAGEADWTGIVQKNVEALKSKDDKAQ